MNCNDLIHHKNKLDNYHANIIEKLDKIQLEFEKNTLVINNKINNYCNDMKNNKDNKKICTDIQNIINEQNNKYNTYIKDFINTVKEEKISKGLPLIIKAPSSDTKVHNYTNTIPNSPPPKYDDKINQNAYTTTPVVTFNNPHLPSAPDINQIHNIYPSAPDINQIHNIGPLYAQTTYVPPITYTPIAVYQLPVSNDKPEYNKYVLDYKKPVYTTRIEPHANIKNKKDKCVII